MFEKDRPCDRVAGRGDSSWPTFWLSHLSGSVTCVNELGVSLTEPVIVVTTSLLNPLTLFFFSLLHVWSELEFGIFTLDPHFQLHSPLDLSRYSPVTCQRSLGYQTTLRNFPRSLLISV
jgi:hypothetical protein